MSVGSAKSKTRTPPGSPIMPGPASLEPDDQLGHVVDRRCARQRHDHFAHSDLHRVGSIRG